MSCEQDKPSVLDLAVRVEQDDHKLGVRAGENLFKLVSPVVVDLDQHGAETSSKMPLDTVDIELGITAIE